MECCRACYSILPTIPYFSLDNKQTTNLDEKVTSSNDKLISEVSDYKALSDISPHHDSSNSDHIQDDDPPVQELMPNVNRKTEPMKYVVHSDVMSRRTSWQSASFAMAQVTHRGQSSGLRSLRRSRVKSKNEVPDSLSKFQHGIVLEGSYSLAEAPLCTKQHETDHLPKPENVENDVSTSMVPNTKFIGVVIDERDDQIVDPSCAHDVDEERKSAGVSSSVPNTKQDECSSDDDDDDDSNISSIATSDISTDASTDGEGEAILEHQSLYRVMKTTESSNMRSHKKPTAKLDLKSSAKAKIYDLDSSELHQAYTVIGLNNLSGSSVDGTDQFELDSGLTGEMSFPGRTDKSPRSSSAGNGRDLNQADNNSSSYEQGTNNSVKCDESGGNEDHSHMNEDVMDREASEIAKNTGDHSDTDGGVVEMASGKKKHGLVSKFKRKVLKK